MKIDIYTTQVCPYCKKAKAWLDNKGLEYTEHALDDPALRESFKQKYPEARTVPQVFVTENGTTTRVGGYTDIIVSDVFK